MSKRILQSGLLVLILLTSLIHGAAAEPVVGIQLGYSANDYSQYLDQSGLSLQEWSRCIWAEYPFDELLFTAYYDGATAFRSSKKAGRNLIQVAANYKFSQQERIQAYGGLGYQYLNAQIDKDGLTGHGFVAQLGLDILVSDQVRTTAVISANPWLKGSLRAGSKSFPGKSSSLNYQLRVCYDPAPEYGVLLGISGGRYGISIENKGAIKGSHIGISLGATYRF